MVTTPHCHPSVPLTGDNAAEAFFGRFGHCNFDVSFDRLISKRPHHK